MLKKLFVQKELTLFLSSTFFNMRSLSFSLLYHKERESKWGIP